MHKRPAQAAWEMCERHQQSSGPWPREVRQRPERKVTRPNKRSARLYNHIVWLICMMFKLFINCLMCLNGLGKSAENKWGVQSASVVDEDTWCPGNALDTSLGVFFDSIPLKEWQSPLHRSWKTDTSEVKKWNRDSVTSVTWKLDEFMYWVPLLELLNYSNRFTKSIWYPWCLWEVNPSASIL
jgi:hypothetical protein